MRGEATDGVRLLLRRARAQDRPHYPQTLAHHLAEVERGARAAERADEQHAPAVAECVEVRVEVRRAHEVEHDVHARAARPRAHRFGEGARVFPDRDAFVHAELARPRDLLGPARGAVDRARARRPRELKSRRADAGAGGVHEHALARLQAALREQRVVRRDEDFGHRRGLGEREVRRNLRQVVFGDDDVLGLRPARRDAEDALPRPPHSHFVARLLDLARELEPRNVGGRARRRGVAPALLQEVCAVHARRTNAHAHAVCARRGPPHLAHLQLPLALVRDDPHGPHHLFAHRCGLLSKKELTGMDRMGRMEEQFRI